ncbi:MAG: glycosyltransferase family 4 protein [Ignavibacteriae bacterium]|nr:glycosyltransferase WbuB [Ignavibacteriota bacterium]NOG97548.1 glycosyltransferase family 4 protein [Ignavibacteriota bacterium]
MKKLLLITQYFPPEIGGGSQRSFGFAKELSDLGVDVTVVTPYPTYLMKKEEVKTKFKLYEKVEQDGIKVYQTFVIATDRGGFFRRILYYLSFTVSAIIVVLSKIKNVDFIITISPPLFTGIAGVILKKFKSAKLVFDIGDLWPESAVQLGFLKNKTAIKLSEKLEKWIYKNSDLINVVTRDTFDKVRSRFGESLPLAYVPNFVNTKIINNAAKDIDLLSKYNLNGKKVFGYAGNIGSAQGVKIITDAAKLTLDRKDIAYLIIGDGVDKDELVKDIKNNNLDNVVLVPPVDKDEIVKYISLFDAMIIPLVKNDLFKITIPSKLYESMAAKIPVLLCVDGEARRIVEEANCGIYIEPENSVMLAEKVKYFNDNAQLAEQFGENGVAVAKEKFDRNVVINSFFEEHLNGSINI